MSSTRISSAFRAAASSVWVITSTDEEKHEPVGFTAISVISVSVDPPIVTFNIGKNSSSLAAVQGSRKFAAHLLSRSDQGLNLAKLFAARPASNRFADKSRWTWDEKGIPQLKDSVISRISGKVFSFTEAGNSYVVLGSVDDVAIHEREGEAPLVHLAGAYQLVDGLNKPETPSVPTSPPVKPFPPPAFERHLATEAADAAPKTDKNAGGCESMATLTAASAQAAGVSVSSGLLLSFDSLAPVPKRNRMFLSAFEMCCVGFQSPGLWAHPKDQSYRYKELAYWTELAQLLEKGRFDTLFLADVVGIYDIYQNSRTPAVRPAAQVPVNDPLPILPAMAAVTKRLGFAATVSLTYELPYAFARRMTTLDHLTKGRVAWNIVTSYLRSAAINMGFKDQIGHDERYKIADEFTEVCYKLWEASWEEDAIVRDAAKGIYTHPEKVHDIEHKGKYFTVPGAHLSEPSPQRTPVLFQAGVSPAGQMFASRHAEAIFVVAVSPEALRPIVNTLRSKAQQQGRDGKKIKIFPLMTVITAETDEAAKTKLEEYQKFGNDDGALTLFGGWTGVDLGTVPIDQPLTELEHPGLRGVGEMFERADPSRKCTPRTIAQFIHVGGLGSTIVGSPKTVVDELERWMSVADVDGFNFTYAITPGTFVDFAELITPELVRRGLLPDLDDKELTLRERLFGEGPRLPEDHPGAKMRRAIPFYQDQNTQKQKLDGRE